MQEHYDWNGEYPKNGDKVIRLPGHFDDHKDKMYTGRVYTVKECHSGNLYVHENTGSWDPNYFAPYIETPKTIEYDIY